VFYSNRGKYKLALKYLNLVSRTKNENLSYQFAIGKAYHYLGEFDKSILHLEKIQNLPQAQYLIARFFASKKNLEQTKIYLFKAAAKQENYWVRVRLDPVFREFINSSTDFSEFVTYRGNPIQTETKPQN
jgi:tetratricopeptide (TPR) repeat protein